LHLLSPALDHLRDLLVLFRHLREAILPQAFRPTPVSLGRLHGSILVQLLGAVIGRHFPPSPECGSTGRTCGAAH
jgi:hypothetical protein